MSNGISENAKGTPNFTLAFKQMASFVAIAKTRATSQVLEELIQQCFVLLPSDPLSTPNQVADALYALFGLRLNHKEVAMALQRLMRAGTVSEVGNSHLALAPAIQASLHSRIDTAQKLESDVREVWLNQARVLAPKLDGEKLWV
jgi:chorismate mutase